MLTIRTGPGSTPYCDRLQRRELLRVGALGLGGLSLADVLRLRAEAGTANKPKSVIMILMKGGPSQHETYDLKPDAPQEFRGEFKPTHTNVPGMDLCELLPLQAKIADKLAILRGIRTVRADHALDEVFTGFDGRAKRPAFGALVSKLRRDQATTLPRYVSLCSEGIASAVEKPGYAGLENAPFCPNGAAMDNMGAVANVSRRDRRSSLLRTVDNLRRDIDATGALDSFDAYTAQAIDIISSSRARDAFDLNQEPESVREKYGPDITIRYGSMGTPITIPMTNLLLARRLVEAGIPIVTLTVGAWDQHCVTGPNIFEVLRKQLPVWDHAIHTLVTDLHERGMDKDVLVLAWGEFGRTSQINKYGGREHNPGAGVALLAGGGLQMGQVIGETDSRGSRSTGGTAIGPQNILATAYHVLGIDPATQIADYNKRPVALLDDRKPIEPLL